VIWYRFGAILASFLRRVAGVGVSGQGLKGLMVAGLVKVVCVLGLIVRQAGVIMRKGGWQISVVVQFEFPQV
jgi:hypothetical protein